MDFTILYRNGLDKVLEFESFEDMYKEIRNSLKVAYKINKKPAKIIVNNKYVFQTLEGGLFQYSKLIKL